MKVVSITAISDLHGHFPKLEGGDLLIVAGDLLFKDSYEELDYFEKWLNCQNYKCKVVVAGNFDNCLERNPKWIGSKYITYLCDSGSEFEGLKIWGSPWTKRFPNQNPNAMAFTVETEEELAEKFALIPDDIDVLVTHCPPLGIRDNRPLTKEEMAQNVSPREIGFGSSSLKQRIWDISTKKDKILYHVFGHVHQGYGMLTLSCFVLDRRVYKGINASYVNERYEPVNKPVRIEL